jgi:hypothetical protein
MTAGWRPRLSNRDFNYSVTTWLGAINRRYDFPDHALNHLPTVATEHDNCNSSIRQILLVAKAIVRRQQYLEARIFCRSQQVSIGKGLPSLLPCGPNYMVCKKRCNLNGRALIEENAHLLSGRRRFETTGCEVEYFLNLLPRQAIVKGY